jgi:outer membrane protein
MNKMLLYVAGTVLLSGAICGCTHPGVGLSDPLSSMSQVPRAPSSPYVSTDASLAMVENIGKEEAAARQDRLAAKDSIPSEFKGKVLTLADCIRVALEFSPETRTTWDAVRSAAARVGEEKSAYLPAVDFAATAARQKQVTFQNLQSGQPIEASNLFDAAFGLSYLLFDGGQRSARVSGSMADLQAIGFQHNTGLQQVVLRVEQSYYALLAVGWALQVAEETVHNTEYHVRLARARFAAGVVPRSDVLKAETQRADADLGLVSARDAVRIAEGTLVSAMGLKVSTPVKIAEIPADAHPQEAEDMERLLEEASRNRPELLAAAAKVKAAQAGIREAKSQYWPKVTANTGYGWIDDALFPNNDQWAVGLNLTFPLFTGFKRGYQVERATSDTDQARAAYASQLRGVELEVWTAYSKLIEAGEAIQAAQVFVASAEESARLATGEYQAGTGNIIALIDAQTFLTSARNRLVQARFAWYTARAQFEKSVGRSLTSDIENQAPDSVLNRDRGAHAATQ